MDAISPKEFFAMTKYSDVKCLITPIPLTIALVVVVISSTSHDFGFDISFLHSEYSVALSEVSHVKVVALSLLDAVIVVRLNAKGFA
ncbi:hypothetical protein VSA01S_31130 [Vibrio sagamiensis NBRC 104589]|uniref:Uncharacterized protein n=1 Tax=Vibrio sagamiensis NBRC 104589 TaxID=1219064 RepID=A0A511QI80_9VIBR|nr:hypothetical protein VSA01S_31130 [Vibrio sagamiensis NBRC 104589]